jgi:hypothetical protein
MRLSEQSVRINFLFADTGVFPNKKAVSGLPGARSRGEH